MSALFAGQALPSVLAPVLMDARIWRASSLGRSNSPCVPSGFAALDAELPGGGWPTQMLSEILLHHSTCAEWRLLGPSLRSLLTPPPLARTGRMGARKAMPTQPLRQMLLINPPQMPHLPGLLGFGIQPQQLIWISPPDARQTLWVLEQAIKANAAAVVLAWLPQAQSVQIRRLQAAALVSQAPVFVFRPWQVRQQSSAAPLRVLLQIDSDWSLRVHVLKRRGPAHVGWLSLPSIPARLGDMLVPRVLQARLRSHLPTKLATREFEHEQTTLAGAAVLAEQP